MQLLADVVDRVLVMWDAKLIADRSPREVFGDAALMAKTKLQPPQVAEISLRIAGRSGMPAALSVSELAAELGPRLHPTAGA
jgi:hypothetical protein